METNNLKKLSFVNYDSSPKYTFLQVSDASIEPIVEWYTLSHCGDRFSVFINGERHVISKVTGKFLEEGDD